MGIVVEEADETVFWLEILTETGVVRAERAEDLQKEANELLAIFSASFADGKTGPSITQSPDDSMIQLSCPTKLPLFPATELEAK
jgi:hypothetical protein